MHPVEMISLSNKAIKRKLTTSQAGKILLNG